jgi:NADH-quinone oxidoreductase subunit H
VALWLTVLIAMVKILALMALFLGLTAYNTLYERRVVAPLQQRIGPNRAGPWGLLQPIADAVKLFFKEDIVTARAEKFLYYLAPILSVSTALLFVAMVPFGPTVPFLTDLPPAWNKFSMADLNVGVLFVLAISSLGVYSVLLGGWSANSKYSLLGGMRAGAQMLSYEVCLGLSLMPAIMSAGSLSLNDIVAAQSDVWNVLRLPWGAIGFFLAIVGFLAESNRAPFDLVEAEQELVAGYHTEYSSMKFGSFFVAEYGNLITISALITTFYLGGWQGAPFVPRIIPEWLAPYLGLVWFFTKTAILVAVFVWIRWTFPRPRYDQLMGYGWKVFFPLALGNVFVASVLIYVGRAYGIGYFG